MGKPFVAIPSYSEVLFLQDDIEAIDYDVRRNPFLFRGPIPTIVETWTVASFLVAIPSYSEVLFLLHMEMRELLSSQSRNPFLFRGPIPTLELEEVKNAIKSQSLLIQRSYSYKTSCSDFGRVVGRNPFLFRGPIPTSGGWD